MMRKIILAMGLMITTLTLTACGNSSEQSQTTEAKTEEAASTTENGNEGNSKTLIAYFTWADNTKITDEEDARQAAIAHAESMGESPDDADAISSASIQAPGNVARMASWIKDEIGGDTFSIQVEELYSSNYDDCMDRASDEKAENARPKLQKKVDNIDDYDTVFIGYPNWWYSVPMPVLSFIEQNKLDGKKVVLFCSHGTGRLAGSVRDITAVLPSDCDVEENVLGIYRNDIPDGKSEVQNWLKDIGY